MGGRTFSVRSLMSGLGVPGGGDPSIVPRLGFAQLSVLVFPHARLILPLHSVLVRDPSSAL